MPKGLRKIKVSFEEEHLTHSAGMFLIHRFCQKLGLFLVSLYDPKSSTG